MPRPMTVTPLQEIETRALVHELRRRYIAFLFAGVRVDGRNEAVTDTVEKGCWELLQHLHMRAGLHVDALRAEEVKLFGAQLGKTLAGNEPADGEITMPL